MIKTLWDLLEPPSPKPAFKPGRVIEPKPERNHSAAERYECMRKEMLTRYGVRVRKWRSGTSGVAWQVYYQDGTISRLIEAPRPRGPVSAAVFLHEIGHHAIGFHTYKPRCLEELHAWRFALDQMDAWGIGITDGVRKRVHESLAYAVEKARRRGLKQIPSELQGYERFSVQPGCWVDPRASVASGPS